MKIALIVKPGHADSGVGRYVKELTTALVVEGHNVDLIHPVIPFPKWLLSVIKKWSGWDLAAFFSTYPLWIQFPQADIYHITSQNLATLLIFKKFPGPTVVTVHDLIPVCLKNESNISSYHHKFDEYLDKVALAGIKKASILLAVTEHSKKMIVEKLSIEPQKIIVVHEGVSSEVVR